MKHLPITTTATFCMNVDLTLPQFAGMTPDQVIAGVQAAFQDDLGCLMAHMADYTLATVVKPIEGGISLTLGFSDWEHIRRCVQYNVNLENSRIQASVLEACPTPEAAARKEAYRAGRQRDKDTSNRLLCTLDTLIAASTPKDGGA